MKILKIFAENFRTLENFSLELKNNYCAISGRNNAGKSAVIEVIQFFFDGRNDEPSFLRNNRELSFERDATQWSNKDYMQISVAVELDRADDAEVFFVVERFSDCEIKSDCVQVVLTHEFYKNGHVRLFCEVDDQKIEGQNASEILKKFRSASNLVVHNSTTSVNKFYHLAGGFTEVLETDFSPEEQKRISDAHDMLKESVSAAVKQHKDELEKLFGRLNDNYQVELSSIEGFRSSRFPLQIKLTDKSVEAPLGNWGTGTQNRTRILMSVLEAVRMRKSVTLEDRSTPVFLVEEPESFLHPSAQAEFGQVLNGLAEELKIQIIATTHSPYMLNQSDPGANYLLERENIRNLPRATTVRDTSGDNWMIPFAENLGIIPSEFKSWKPVFSAYTKRVILVEGNIDKSYFEYFRDNYSHIYPIPKDVEIISYEGKDSIKNTPILQFMVSRFGKVFITFDLDAKSEIETALKRINLKENVDYMAIGVDSPGSNCIEGLLPISVKKAIYAEKHELITAISSADTKARNKAKSELKKHLLFKLTNSPLTGDDLKPFQELFSNIANAFK